ncbi:hypothetical protein GCK32_022515, partial [Trichostrongylus colubriformis]
MRYMTCLEPSGFTNIKVDYKSDEKAGEYQLISCMRPLSDEVRKSPRTGRNSAPTVLISTTYSTYQYMFSSVRRERRRSGHGW